MLRYGFEVEFFVLRKKQHVICPKNVPMDECGWLAEARGKEHSDPLEAAYSLAADVCRLHDKAAENKVTLGKMSYAELTPELMREARRVHGKREYPEGRGNIRGLDYDADDKLARAGLHIHFSDYDEYWDKDNNIKRNHHPLNMPRVIQAFDKTFAKEIIAEKRLPGFYEMKPWGFEYRSLPCNVDLIRVAKFLQKEKF